MTQPQDAANALLMGGGVKSVKWGERSIGATVIGAIVEQPKAVQMMKYKPAGSTAPDEPDFWPSGDPKMQIIVVLQTDERDPSDATDDGKRRLYIEPRMMTPVREAVQRASAPGLAIGGRLAIRWASGTGQGEGNARQFAAEYSAPVVDPGSMLAGNGNGHAVAAPQAPMLATNGAAPAQQPAQQTPLQQSVLGTPAPAAAAAPPAGVDPNVWANLPDGQKQAILAAMAPASTPF